MAKEKIQVPLTFELGWQRHGSQGQAAANPAAPQSAQAALR